MMREFANKNPMVSSTRMEHIYRIWGPPARLRPILCMYEYIESIDICHLYMMYIFVYIYIYIHVSILYALYLCIQNCIYMYAQIKVYDICVIYI